MLESLKIDIIYYGTPSDFEMEFNLGGCARCRILNASTSSAKETVKALATAVGRSRVILITGPLFGNQALLSLIPRAVGLPCEPVDKAAFSISSTGDIEIPQGAMPLVDSNGVFGGCILESGPQSIILLTENKSLRNRLMNSLIHSYITSLSRTPDTENDLIRPENAVTHEQPTVEETTDEAMPAAESIPESCEPEPAVQSIPMVAAPVDPSAALPIAEALPAEKEESLPLQKETPPTEEIPADTPLPQEPALPAAGAVRLDPVLTREDPPTGADRVSDSYPESPKDESPLSIDLSHAASYFSPHQPVEEIDSGKDLFDEPEDFKEAESEDLPIPSAGKQAPKKKNDPVGIMLSILVAVLLILCAAAAYVFLYMPKINGKTVADFFKETLGLIARIGVFYA